ncbi:MAG: HIT family protein [Akkermansiaceae bacterium]|nr:HIT family protein [Armatimonadota bacterium]
MRWKSPEEWSKLTSGETCPMCQDIHRDENPHSFLVTELPTSYVRLPRNQWMRGWTIVALKRHACELFELSPEELAGFWRDVAVVAKALDGIYQPTKINYCVFGHHCPHIHCHLLIHSFADDPGKPVDMQEQTVLLSDGEYRTMIHELRERISHTPAFDQGVPDDTRSRSAASS